MAWIDVVDDIAEVFGEHGVDKDLALYARLTYLAAMKALTKIESNAEYKWKCLHYPKYIAKAQEKRDKRVAKYRNLKTNPEAYRLELERSRAAKAEHRKNKAIELLADPLKKAAHTKKNVERNSKRIRAIRQDPDKYEALKAKHRAHVAAYRARKKAKKVEQCTTT